MKGCDEKEGVRVSTHYWKCVRLTRAYTYTNKAPYPAQGANTFYGASLECL